MKTTIHLPVSFKFPDTNDTSIEYETGCSSVTQSEILGAMAECSELLWIAIDEELKEQCGDIKRLVALAIGICLWNAGQIETSIGGE